MGENYTTGPTTSMKDLLIITNIGGQQPVQAEGFIDGMPFYMRLRSSSTLSITNREQGPGQGWLIDLDDLVPQVMTAEETESPWKDLPDCLYTGLATQEQAHSLLLLGMEKWNEDRDAYCVPPKTPMERLAEGPLETP